MNKSKLFVVLGSIVGIGIIATILKGRQVKKVPGDLKIDEKVDNVDEEKVIYKETQGSSGNNEDIENEILLDTEEGFRGEVIRLFNMKIKDRNDLSSYAEILNELTKESYMEHGCSFVDRLPQGEGEFLLFAELLGFRKEIDNIVMKSYEI